MQYVGRGRDHEEIGGDDLADVIPQEGSPGLRRRLAPSAPPSTNSAPIAIARVAMAVNRIESSFSSQRRE
jgi:hypothetical protein